MPTHAGGTGSPPQYPATAGMQASQVPQGSVTPVSHSLGDLEGQPLGEGLLAYPSPSFARKKPIERILSHQGSSIHAEWCQALNGTPSNASSGSGSRSGSISGDHVQLSLGEESLFLELPLAEGKGGKDGSRKKESAAQKPKDTCQQASESCGTELIPADAYMRLACWLALLFAGYGFQRGLCAGGLPYDCDAVDASEVYSTLTTLAFVGGALGWLAGVTRPARFAWLSAPSRFYLWLAYAITLPAYSAIATIPAMHQSLASLSEWGAPTIAVISAVGIIVLAAVAFHIWLATYPTQSSSHLEGSSLTTNRAVVSPELAALGSNTAATSTPAAASPPESLSGSSGGGSSLSPEGSLSIFNEKLSRSSGGSGSGSCGRNASGSSERSNSGGSPRADTPLPAKPGRRVRRALFPSTNTPPRQRCFKTLRLYLLPRSAVLLYFVVWFAALAGSGSFDLHLHHYALGWAAASLAAFNHPMSGMLLALGTAVFVQGAGSYGFDPLFTPAGNSTGGCLNVTSPKTGQMTCAFWAEQPFNISFCSDTNWLPWFDCSVDWPWAATKITKKMLRLGNLSSLVVPDPLTPLVPLVPLIAG